MQLYAIFCVTIIKIYNGIVLDTVLQHEDAIDYSKVELVKSLKKKKFPVWIGFLLFGWSYGSLGKMGFQALWYIISLFTLYSIWITFETNTFDQYSAMAIMGVVVMVFWFIIRVFTLNRDIKKYNDNLAEHFYLTPKERAEAGIV